jgi:hypothetical protein
LNHISIIEKIYKLVYYNPSTEHTVEIAICKHGMFPGSPALQDLDWEEEKNQRFGCWRSSSTRHKESKLVMIDDLLLF